MNLPPPVVEWRRTRGWGVITEAVPVGGGCIHRSFRLRTSAGGGALFLKTNDDVPEDLFEREAEGLKALRVDGGPRVPEPLRWADSFLLLEDLAPAGEMPGYWERLGRELARLHSQINWRFGFDHDNYLGRTPQPNPWSEDGREFFARHRLLFQAERAHAAGLLGAGDVRGVEVLAGRLASLASRIPVVAILRGWPLRGETPPPRAGGGGALCLPGVSLARR